MSVALKKAKAPSTAKNKPAPKAAHLVSEVDVLIARLKKIRKVQAGGFDIRQAIEHGRA